MELLERYGTKWIDIRRLRNGSAQLPRQPVIGRDYVPPLGGVSVIDRDRVAPPSHRRSLEAAGYQPWKVEPQPQGAIAWMAAAALVAVALAALCCTGH
jgi:hypothetical protein